MGYQSNIVNIKFICWSNSWIDGWLVWTCQRWL